MGRSSLKRNAADWCAGARHFEAGSGIVEGHGELGKMCLVIGARSMHAVCQNRVSPYFV